MKIFNKMGAVQNQEVATDGATGARRGALNKLKY